MAIVLDETTRAEYLAQSLASSRASGIVSALGSTVYVEVYDSSNVLRASGTMASPWATASGATITVGEVNAAGMVVSSGGVPDSLWYAQFRGSNGRFVRGTFGVSTDTADFTWSHATFQTGSRGTLGTVTLTTSGAADGSGPTVNVTTFQVTSALGGSNLPWAFGHVFKQGDVPTSYNVVSDEPGFQSTVLNRWGDGSVKFAVIAGRSTFTANVARTITIQRGTSSLGTPIGLPALQARITSAGQYTVSLGGAGTCDLFSALFTTTSYTAANTGNKKWSAGLVRQWVAGPTMSEWHFYTPAPADNHLAVFWQVRLWSGGEIEVEVVVDNGWLLTTGQTQKDYTPVVVIGGVTQTAIGAISHLARTRWSRSYWVGTNPLVTPSHNTAYLQSTKVVPPYGWQPTASALASWTTAENTAPFAQANWPSGMGNAGTNGSLAEQFDAHYIMSGDVRAYRAVIGNARAAGRYALIQRDETTLKPIKFANYGNLVHDGFGLENSGVSTVGQTTPSPTGTTPPLYFKSHQRPLAALAYLLTGKWHFGETALFQATTNFLAQTDSNRQYTAGILRPDVGALQTRGAAWSAAALARAAALVPDAEATSYSFADSLASNVDYFNTNFTGQNALGLVLDYTNYDPGTATNTWWLAGWQQAFFTIAYGYAQEIAGHLLDATRQSRLDAFRKWLAKLPVGLLGGNSTSEFCYRSAANYTINVGTTASIANEAAWNAAMRADWGAVYTATFGSANTSCASGQTLLGTSGSDPSLLGSDAYCYWAIINGAISYAVDSGATGAAAAYGRLTGATNFTSNAGTVGAASNFGSQAIYAFRPRLATTLPSWYTSAPSGQWVAVPSSTFSASSAYTAAAASGIYSYGVGVSSARPVVEAWNSGFLNTVGVYHNNTFIPGLFLCIWGGGHADYAGNEVYAFGPLDSESPQWRMLCDPTVPPPTSVGRDANGKPVSRHTYDSIGYISGSNKMISVAAPPVYVTGGSFPTADTFSFGVNPNTTNPWTPIGTTTTTAYGAQHTQCVVDEAAGKVYGLWRNGPLFIYDIASNTWTQKAGFSFPWDWYNCTADIDPVSKVIVQVDGETTVGGPSVHGIDTRTPSGTIATFTITASGQPTGAPVSTVYDSRTGKWVSWTGGKTLYFLTPPANPYQGSGWTWSSVTPASGDTPPAGISQGTYKRFGALPATMPGYYLMARWDSPVYIYKP